MRRSISILLVSALMCSLVIPALAVGPKHEGPEERPKAAGAIGAEPVVSAQAEPLAAPETVTQPSDYTPVYADASADTLWEQFAQAEAYKKLYEIQERAVREQLRFLEGPSAYYSYTDGSRESVYAQLMELKNQEYELKLQKEQYEWQKKQAESYLKLLGERPDRAQLEYDLYSGAAALSGLSYEELCMQRLDLQAQEQQLKWQLESLEYQYQLGQIDSDAFVSQFADLFQQKETVKIQREMVDIEIHYLFGPTGPGAGLGPGAAPRP